MAPDKIKGGKKKKKKEIKEYLSKVSARVHLIDQNHSIEDFFQNVLHWTKENQKKNDKKSQY